MDLTSKLPWLKARTQAEVDEEEGHEGGGPPEKTTPTNHTPNPLEIEFEGQNDGDWSQQQPPLPPKDYDLSLSPSDLPPRDYPTQSPDHVTQLERTGDLISDDDYYAKMMNAFNS